MRLDIFFWLKTMHVHIFVTQVQRIRQIGARFNVELQIQSWAGCIVGDGLHHACFDCMQEISTVIREIERKRQKKEAASMLANMIQWCYLEVGAIIILFVLFRSKTE